MNLSAIDLNSDLSKINASKSLENDSQTWSQKTSTRGYIFSKIKKDITLSTEL